MTSSYFRRALEHLERAFAPPRYLGERTAPVLADVKGPRELRVARDLLWRDRRASGVSAENAYYLAVVDRHLGGDPKASAILFREALAADPKFDEAAIALREGARYLDPYCYPSWEQLRTAHAKPRPLERGRPESFARIDLARMRGTLFPTISIYESPQKFRSRLSDATAMTVAVDIVALVPALSAMMHVLPVIFDDPDDPYWKSLYLNLFPSGGELRGIEIRMPEDYDPWLGRDIARRFCAAPYRCGLLVVLRGRLALAKLVEADPRVRGRYGEMAEVLRVLSEDEVLRPYEWSSAVQTHGQTFVSRIRAPDGRELQIPRRRSPAGSEMIVLPIVSVGDQLVTRALVEASRSAGEGGVDLFISHAHADTMWGIGVERWLSGLWPGLRIGRTDPTEPTADYADLGRFFGIIRDARVVVLLATPEALTRPVVRAELGAAGLKPIIVLLAGGVRRSDLRRLMAKDQFLKIDAGLVCNLESEEGWQVFADRVASKLGIRAWKKVPPGPSLGAPARSTSSDDAMSAFASDMAHTFEVHSGLRPNQAQTEEDACQILDEVEAHMTRRAAREGHRLPISTLKSLSPRSRLLALATTVPDEEALRRLLGAFPALTDDHLLGLVTTAARQECGKGEGADQQVLRALWLMQRLLGAGNLSTGRPRPSEKPPLKQRPLIVRAFRQWWSRRVP